MIWISVLFPPFFLFKGALEGVSFSVFQLADSPWRPEDYVFDDEPSDEFPTARATRPRRLLPASPSSGSVSPCLSPSSPPRRVQHLWCALPSVAPPTVSASPASDREELILRRLGLSIG